MTLPGKAMKARQWLEGTGRKLPSLSWFFCRSTEEEVDPQEPGWLVWDHMVIKWLKQKSDHIVLSLPYHSVPCSSKDLPLPGQLTHSCTNSLTSLVRIDGDKWGQIKSS